MGYFKMIQMIELGLQGKGCLWINENPNIIYPVIEVINRDLATGLIQKSDRKSSTRIINTRWCKNLLWTFRN